MRIDTKAGHLIPVTLGKDPELKTFSSGATVLKLSGRYTLAKNPETGKHGSDFLNIDVWDGAADLDGMFQKGDALIVTGDEIKDREYGGKIYHDIRASGVYPSSEVVFRWLQDAINMILTGSQPAEISPPAAQAPAAAQAPVPEPVPLYEGEQLSDYAPEQVTTRAEDHLGDAFIDDDDDLPF